MRSQVLIGLLLSFGGCGFAGSDSTDGMPNDGTPDGKPPGDGAPCSGWPQPPAGVDLCTAPPPTGGLMLDGNHVFDTNTGTFDPGPTVATILVGTEPDCRRIVSLNRLVIAKTATVRVVGSCPVVFLVHGPAEVHGTVDASAWLDQTMWRPGPGGDIACTTGKGAIGTASSDGAGGGGGAGFGATGGPGGKGDVVPGGANGVTEGSAAMLSLRGGCRGGRGGDGDNSSSSGLGGPGGGGLQIAVRDHLAVTGSLRAVGGPGLGATDTNGGGGGGGSGGAVVLSAASIVVGNTAAICANGGGGGGGANDGGPFNPGGNGSIGTCENSGAPGGPGGASNGQPGGKGGFHTMAAGPGRGADEGGGGGGGGVGRIRITAPMTPMISGIVTPPAM